MDEVENNHIASLKTSIELCQKVIYSRGSDTLNQMLLTNLLEQNQSYI